MPLSPDHSSCFILFWRSMSETPLMPSRLSAKLFKCTPEQLPGDLKANLLAMLQCGVNALEGYIRPGCLHLTLNAMLG